MSVKGLGHIPDLDRDVARDLRKRPAAALIGATLVPQYVDFSSLIGDVFDQLATSSCVGNASSKSLFTRAVIEGKPIPPVSRKGIYDVARLVDGPYQAIVDEGSRPAAAFIGMRDFGVVTEARWPLAEENINQLPTLDVFVHGIDGLVPSHYRIPPGEGCATMIRQALGRGYCPVFAMPVDESYQNYDGSAVFSMLQGPPLGGHYQCAIGCVPGSILVVNSWGVGWGLDGKALISDSFFDSNAVSDVLVVTTSPEKVT